MSESQSPPPSPAPDPAPILGGLPILNRAGGTNGRPPELTEAVAQKIIGLIMQGNYIIESVLASGITKATWQNWCKRGEEEPESAFGRFLAACERARAEGQVLLTDKLRKAGQGDDWRKWAWIKERSAQDRWAPRKQVEEKPEDGATTDLASALQKAKERRAAKRKRSEAAPAIVSSPGSESTTDAPTAPSRDTPDAPAGAGTSGKTPASATPPTAPPLSGSSGPDQAAPESKAAGENSSSPKEPAP